MLMLIVINVKSYFYTECFNIHIGRVGLLSYVIRDTLLNDINPMKMKNIIENSQT